MSSQTSSKRVDQAKIALRVPASSEAEVSVEPFYATMTVSGERYEGTEVRDGGPCAAF